MPGWYFLRDSDTVFHTYSTYACGAEMTDGSYYSKAGEVARLTDSLISDPRRRARSRRIPSARELLNLVVR